jgi:ABC-type nitrate/sulfonate/bicarbonate transport system permease component
LSRAATTFAGIAALAALWEIAGHLPMLRDVVPPLSAVLGHLASPHVRALLSNAIAYTGVETVAGLVAGAIAGIACASFSRLIPAAAPGLFAFASIVNGIPIIAVAGICVLTLPREMTPLVVAALAAAFIVFVGTTTGLRAASDEQRDLFLAYGGSRWATFERLDAPSAAPFALAAIRSAAPVSVVGAILGEWFTAEHGLGPMLIAALQNYDTVALWSIALVCAALSLALYALLGAAYGIAERAVT